MKLGKPGGQLGIRRALTKMWHYEGRNDGQRRAIDLGGCLLLTPYSPGKSPQATSDPSCPAFYPAVGISHISTLQRNRPYSPTRRQHCLASFILPVLKTEILKHSPTARVSQIHYSRKGFSVLRILLFTCFPLFTPPSKRNKQMDKKGSGERFYVRI